MQLRSAIAALVLTSGTLLAQAPAGYRTFTDEDTGLECYVPAEYVEIPLPPTEMSLKARFLRKTPPDELIADKKNFKPEVEVFCFPRRPRNVTPPPGPDATPPPDAVPKTIQEAMEKAQEVRDFDEFKEKRLAAWKLDPVPGKEGHYHLVPKANPELPQAGYLVVRNEKEWVYGICGLTMKPHLAKMRGTVSTMGQGLRLPDQRDRAASETVTEEALDRAYPPGKFRATEHRKKVRRSLARGWKAVDTENYIVVHHSQSEKLINKIVRDIEAMRSLYERLFPAVRPVDKVSIVRVCRNRSEFLAYGGPPTAGGYWHPGNEELVFYDYDQTTLDNEAAGVEARKTTDKDSLLVLYHEAFHQYIHFAVGEVAPHDWFNEGHGDYFSGAVIPQYGTKVDRVGPSPWRIHRAKDQCEKAKGFIPLKDLVQAERKDYYNPQRVSDYYAAGWSFVYFLRESEKVKKHPRWSQLLDDYFDALKKAFADEMALKGSAATLPEKMQAQEAARRRALKVFLEDLDLDALEAEWKAFVVKMKDPWPERRKK